MRRDLIEVAECGRATGPHRPRLAARSQHVLLDVREMAPSEVQHAADDRIEMVDKACSLQEASRGGQMGLGSLPTTACTLIKTVRR